jgi:hypothetical protein
VKTPSVLSPIRTLALGFRILRDDTTPATSDA